MDGDTGTRTDSIGHPSARRIAVVDAYPWQVGGAHRATASLLAALRGSLWTGFVVMPADGSAAQWLRERGVRVDIVPAPASLMRFGGRLRGAAAIRAVLALPRYWWRLRRYLRGGADVVWANDLRGLWLAGPAARLAGKPAVWQLHARQPQYRWTARVAAVLCRRIVVPSQASRAELPRMSLPVDVLPNTVATVAGQRVAPEGTPTVVTVARLHPDKGIETLLRAAASLQERGVDIRLVVVGGPQPGYESYAQQLEALGRSLGLRAISFTGPSDDPSEHVARATVYVQPSRYETFGLATLEAMAMGVPVVVSATGGLVDLVRAEVTGLVVPPDDPVALADAVVRLLRDPALGARLGAAARAAAQRDYGEQRYQQKALEVLTAAMATRR